MHGRGTDLDAFERQHTKFLEVMHVEVLAGRVGLDEARRERFRRVFLAFGIALDDAGRRCRRVGLPLRLHVGAPRARRRRRAPAALRPHARIGIVTNNLLEEQRDKLAYCGLARAGRRVDRVGRRRRVEAGPRHLRHRARPHGRGRGRRGDGRRLVGQRRRRRDAAPASARSGSTRIAQPAPADPPGVAEIHALRRRRTSCRCCSVRLRLLTRASARQRSDAS